MRKQNLEQPTGVAFLSQRDLLSQDRHRASLCTLGRVGHLRCTLSVTSLITCSPLFGVSLRLAATEQAAPGEELSLRLPAPGLDVGTQEVAF